MKLARIFILSMSCFVFFTGCQHGKAIGWGVTSFLVEGLLGIDDEGEKSCESRRHWNEATSGGWDGVNYEAKY